MHKEYIDMSTTHKFLFIFFEKQVSGLDSLLGWPEGSTSSLAHYPLAPLPPPPARLSQLNPFKALPTTPGSTFCLEIQTAKIEAMLYIWTFKEKKSVLFLTQLEAGNAKRDASTSER